MKLREFLEMTTSGSMIRLMVNGDFVLLDSLEYYYKDFWSWTSTEFNSHIINYLDYDISDFTWTNEYLNVNIYTEEAE